MSARTIFASIVLVALAFGSAVADKAERPNPAFAGRIMLSDKRFPTQAKSLAAFNAQVRKQSKSAFAENKTDKNWKIYFAGFLKAPLNDVEYMVKLYDVTGRQQQLLASFEQFTDSRGQTALMSNMTLERKTIGVNKEIMITLESHGKVLAASRFKITGEGDRYTGKVNFSEDEANGKSNDDE
ncbi:MAG TPA: hypothetical protein VFQ53_42595 [Kofleriaceae bacterium]|nr:hypothetical protein [Kofleriaceae bacterium]